MKIELLPENGQFYKVNMHCHTNISDGKQTPEEVKEYFKSLGYSAVCYTDHEVLIGHKELCDDEFVALHGYEVAIKKDLNAHTACFMPVYHLNLIAKSQDNLTMPLFFKDNNSWPGNAKEWAEKHGKYEETIPTVVYDKDWLNWYIAGVSKAGFFVNYNHPCWSLQSSSDYLGLENLHSIEVINSGCVRLNDNTSLHFEQMLRHGMRVAPTGGDDNHGQGACGKGWTMIKAPALTYEALMTAYGNGDCYASEGPEIRRLVIEDGKIVVETSPAAGIYMMSEGRHSGGRTLRGETMTRAEFAYEPEKMGKYFRIEVRDAAGFRAFSNAYYTEDIARKMSAETN